MITPTKGLQQVDPLSPYFILCAEGLSTVINRVKREGGITGLFITKGGTRLNHLFFANDIMLFCKDKVPELSCLLKVLDIYEKKVKAKIE
jgi:hypothetical protein